MALMTASE